MVLDFYSSLATLESEVLISAIYYLIYKAKKKFPDKQNLLETYSWVLVIFVPAAAAIPVLFSIFPQNPQFILAPFWLGLFIWLYASNKAKLNQGEESHRLSMQLRMGWILFPIGIGAHLLLYCLQAMIHNNFA